MGEGSRPRAYRARPYGRRLAARNGSERFVAGDPDRFVMVSLPNTYESWSMRG